MSSAKGVHEYYSSIRGRLSNYIKSDYLANSETLLEYAGDLLGETASGSTNIAREPYIETAASYKKIPRGIETLTNVGTGVKNTLLKLVDANLGIFSSPFAHQVKECFLWPILAKTIGEAQNHPDYFKQNAVRTLIIYPMNALVSDQLARFRKTMGGEQFRRIFTEDTQATRIPHFGMYTGRTSYAGDSNMGRSKKLAQAYRKRYLIDDSSDERKKKAQALRISGLKKINKYPARFGEDGIERFIDQLEQNEHTPTPYDAELITRFEMVSCPPDILVTNYSMLEYMLMRKREANIWAQTKEWLHKDDENKLLIVLDEAHMYRGSAGGEIALLLDRLFDRLGITLEKVQFILTTASMPDDESAIKDFYYGLTGKSWDHCEPILGVREEIHKGCFLLMLRRWLQLGHRKYMGQKQRQEFARLQNVFSIQIYLKT